MSLEKAEITWSNLEIWRMVLDGRIDLEHIIQRGAEWDRNRQARLIESQLLGYPIPSIFAKKSTDQNGRIIYSIMDGKQRILSIKKYLNNEFAMPNLPPVTYFDMETGSNKEIDLTGKRFNSLPESLKNLIRTMQIKVIYFDNLTKDEERELFKRLNAGKPLAAKSKALAECNDLEEAVEISNHNLFNMILSDRARENKNQVVILMKMKIMLTHQINKISFDSRQLNSEIANIRISDDERESLILLLDTIDNIYDHLQTNQYILVARKLTIESILVSVTPFIWSGIRSGKSIEQLANWLIEFFNVKGMSSISEEFNHTLMGGTTKHTNIVIRHNALMKHYRQYFGEEAIYEL